MMLKTRRVKIVTGLKCNIRCVFCYYQDNLKAPNRTYDNIAKDLAYAARHGIQAVDFSGGEPTTHPRLGDLIRAAKALGMQKVAIISNGWKLADRSYLRSLRDSGLDEILFSVHGSKSTVHEELTSTAGSFERIADALANALEEGLEIRTNTVVNRVNLDDLTEIALFVLNFKPKQVNFITINDWCFAKHLIDSLMLTYSEMSPHLIAACDLLEEQVDEVNVRYIPFCFMKGYERFVCNHKQVQYDQYEWVPRVRARLEVQNNLFRYLGILSYGFFIAGGFKNLGRMAFPGVLDECVVEALRKWFYTKHPDCSSCRLNLICDGVENTYAKSFGLGELSPQRGSVVHDSTVFRKDRISPSRDQLSALSLVGK